MMIGLLRMYVKVWGALTKKVKLVSLSDYPGFSISLLYGTIYIKIFHSIL